MMKSLAAFFGALLSQTAALAHDGAPGHVHAFVATTPDVTWLLVATLALVAAIALGVLARGLMARWRQA